jgi:heme/copper-type cytochrome/quinol oxidase subunit 4
MSLTQIVAKIVAIVNGGLIPLLYALAFVYLLIGLVRYFFIEGGNEESREKGKQMLIYGMIGIVVIFSVWGLVNLFLSTLNSVAGT